MCRVSVIALVAALWGVTGSASQPSLQEDVPFQVDSKNLDLDLLGVMRLYVFLLSIEGTLLVGCAVEVAFRFGPHPVSSPSCRLPPQHLMQLRQHKPTAHSTLTPGVPWVPSGVAFQCDKSGTHNMLNDLAL